MPFPSFSCIPFICHSIIIPLPPSLSSLKGVYMNIALKQVFTRVQQWGTSTVLHMKLH
jgi:hypothetical protein